MLKTTKFKPSNKMKAEKRKNIPSYIYQKEKTPDQGASPEVIKKKLKFHNTTNQDGTNFIDILPQDADESIAGTQLSVQEDKAHSTTPRNSLTFTGTMTKEELNNHIQKCLEMSSEGKITPKNAFALQLIDCMNLLWKKEDFSIMACTLDAGQKIYAHRVDGLHQQVIKLAEEVINNQKKKESADNENTDNESGKKLKNEQRKPNKKNTIVAAESLKRKLKCKDPKERFVKIDGLPGAIMSSVRRDPADLSFTLENNVPFWHDWEHHKPHKVNGTVTIPHCEIYRDKEDLRQRNSLLTFSPTQGEKDTLANDDTEIPTLEGLSDDNGGLTDDIIMDELDFNDMNVDTEENDDNKSDKMEVDVVCTAVKRLNGEVVDNKEICTAPSRLEAMKIIFKDVSDYHYLNMNKAYYWAGPEFWKRPKATSMDCKEKKKVSRKKKSPHSISYTGPEADEKVNKVLKKGSKLNKKAVMGWRMKNVTYATDLKIGIGQFLDLFHMPVFNELEEVSQSSEININTAEAETSNENNDSPQDDAASITSDNEDPLNSCFYESAPENTRSPDNSDALNSAFYDAGLTPKVETEIQNTETGKIVKVKFSSIDNSDATLVPAPKKVNFEPLKYKTKPIRVDMQHLKDTIWGIINEDIDNNKKEQRENTADKNKPSPGTKFSSVLNKLPCRLESRTAEDMFPGMALLALLTLANENNLQLKNSENFSDIVISFENENSVDQCSNGKDNVLF